METIKIWPGWEIKEQIGEGDLGRVFRIERTDAGVTREAALKVIGISGDAGEIKRLRKMGMDEESILEIYEDRKDQLLAAAARLSCLRTACGIASVEDIDSSWDEETSSWSIQIRSEFLESLDAYGKRAGEMLPEEIARMGRDISGALMTLEKEGIISLSVKPSNILRNSEGAYKLSDAGINEGTGRLAASKVGSIFSWDAPELVRAGNYDGTSDIYSLGMIMYVLLNRGQRPFLPEDGSMKRWMRIRIANEKRVSGEALPKPACGDEKLQEIVMKACAPNAQDRYQNAGELREALEYWLIGQKYGMAPAKASAIQESPIKSEAVELPSEEPQTAEAVQPGDPEAVNYAASPEEPEVEIPAGPHEADIFTEPAEEPVEAENVQLCGMGAEIFAVTSEEPEAEIPVETHAAEDIFTEPAEEPRAEIPALPEEEGILRVKADEEPKSDADDAPWKVSLFKKTVEEPEIGTAPVLSEESDAGRQDPPETDFFGMPEQSVVPETPDLPEQPAVPETPDLPEQPAAEPEFGSGALFHMPDDMDVQEEKAEEPDMIPRESLFGGFGEEDEATALVDDSDREALSRPESLFHMDNAEKSLDDSVSDFFRSAGDLDEEKPDNEAAPVTESRPEVPGTQESQAGGFFGWAGQGPSQEEDQYGATIVEAPDILPAREAEKEALPPTADLFIYIFQRDDRLYGIHSVVSENGGGARFKMKSDVLETGLFETILGNLKNRSSLPIENAYVTIESGASKEDYEARRQMVLAAGLKSVTVLDDAAVNALGIFAEELTGQEGDHYVLSVIHDYSGFRSSLLRFDTGDGTRISVLKSAPTGRVVDPMENPAFVMDRMLQDNCRVDGVDYSDRVERVLVDNRNRPLMGSVGQGSYDPYYNEAYGSIFRRANLYEGIEALKGLAYVSGCEKGEKKGVHLNLSVYEEPVRTQSEENYAGATEQKGSFVFPGAESSGREAEFGRDLSGGTADPGFSTTESTMVGPDPFGGSPADGSSNPFGAGAGSFGESADPFGAGAGSFGESADPFGAGAGSFGESPDPFGAGAGSFGESADPFGAGAGSFGGGSDPFGAGAGSFGSADPYDAGGETMNGSAGFSAGGDLFNATVAGDAFPGQMNGGAPGGSDPYRNELTADGFMGNPPEGFPGGAPSPDGAGRQQDMGRGRVPSGIPYSDKGRIFMLNEKKPIIDVTMEVSENGIDLFRKDMKIALAFGMIGSAIEGKGKQFAHIDFSQVSGFGYETPNPKLGQRPALYTTDGKVYIFDFRNAESTERILREIAGVGAF